MITEANKMKRKRRGYRVKYEIMEHSQLAYRVLHRGAPVGVIVSSACGFMPLDINGIRIQGESYYFNRRYEAADVLVYRYLHPKIIWPGGAAK
jgi:hypothetical protein